MSNSTTRLFGIGCALIALTAASGCCLFETISSAPGSRSYVPTSPMEAEAFAATSRTIHPSDVALGAGPNDVAWAGIVRRRAFTDDTTGGFALRLLVEHRFFDWIEDHGAQRERYFLSPRGEELFETCWWMPSDWREGIEPLVREGDMVIVYGRASRSDAGLVVAPPRYLRLVPSEAWRDDVLDYARPGTPTRNLGTPMFGDTPVRAPLQMLAPERGVTSRARAAPIHLCATARSRRNARAVQVRVPRT